MIKEKGYTELNLPLVGVGAANKMLIVQKTQGVTFAYDDTCKGRGVSMMLKSIHPNNIDAPNYQIIFEQKDLKKILEFLIESEI